MFNANLLIIFVGISLPGILLLIPSLKKLHHQLKQKTTKKFPSPLKFIIISTAQSIIFVLIASTVGIILSSKVGLHAPFLELLSKGIFSTEVLLDQIYAGVLLGFAGSIIFLIIYYKIIKEWLDPLTFEKMNDLRHSVGLGVRIFYGGIVEEILFRWGVMTLLVWIGLEFSIQKIYVLWLSILLTGILFGICHLPAYLINGCKKSSKFMVTVIGLNLFASVVFGWAFAKFGFCSAMIAHAVFHCVWYPVDKKFSSRGYIKSYTRI